MTKARDAVFPDEGAGPDDTQEELDDPIYQEAAQEIREASIDAMV